MKITGKQVFVRTMITLGLPFILVWAFIAELWSGIKDAFYYAWCEVRINFDQYKTQMRKDDY